MNKKDKRIISVIIGILILMALISGCIQSGKQEYKPLIEENDTTNATTNATANATNESKINESSYASENTANTGLSNESNVTSIANQTEKTGLNISKTPTEPELKYLFSWDDATGDDKLMFLKFLKEDLNLYWADDAKIKKSADNKTITVSYERNVATLKINEGKNTISAEIIQMTRTEYDVIFKTEDGKLNIYKPKPKPKPQIKRIKFDIQGLMSSGDAHMIDSKLRDFPGIIYVNIDLIGQEGEVLFDESKITKENVLKEAGFIKTPGGLIVMDLTVTLTEEVNCTKSNDVYCCGGETCRLYM